MSLHSQFSTFRPPSKSRKPIFQWFSVLYRTSGIPTTTLWQRESSQRDIYCNISTKRLLIFCTVTNKCTIKLDVFVRASLHMRREEKPTRCHWLFYCTYNMLNMFRALLCPSSGARDYMCVITAYGAQFLLAGFRGSGAEQPAMCLGRGMLHD